MAAIFLQSSALFALSLQFRQSKQGTAERLRASVNMNTVFTYIALRSETLTEP